MSANRQIGWSQEAILLWGVSKQLERLAGLIAASGGGGGGTTGGLKTVDSTPLTTTLKIISDNTGVASPLRLSTNSVTNFGGGNVASSTAFGDGALVSATNAPENTAFGFQALNAATGGVDPAGGYNAAFGWGALRFNTTGNSNVAVGDAAAQANTTANWNTAVGAAALRFNQFGEQNVAIGAFALYQNVGVFASNVQGHRSVAIGSSAMQKNTIGNGIAIGDHALFNQTSGASNICIGAQAGSGISTGLRNTIVAGTGFVASGGGITTGNDNLILAPNDGNTTGITTGSGNVVVGKVTGLAAGATNTITLADGVGNIRQKFDTNGQPSFNALHTAPATATSTGVTGEFRFTATGIFLCVATNVWVKATLATF